MFKNNVCEILKRIKENDIVLDIGGWFNPFNRANWVIDFMPYETRAKGGGEGPAKEYFTEETWIQRDLCDRKPLPFKNKEIDFIICSHTLEDIRDPLFVCSEICRVGKRGYIETPSLISELSFVASKHYVGYSHHRWIIEIRNNKVTFFFKPHFLHCRWKYHFPRSYSRSLKPEQHIQSFFWEESFQFEEDIAYCLAPHDKIEQFVKSQHAYLNYRYKIEKFRESVKKIRDKFRTW